ncbi:MAG TPA: SDR family oxidoreductase [Opitutus sp.]|nr:SDR family oxidoreductase [Opitutus sp.]
MNVLFIGGTGIISTACTEFAVARGFDVTLLNRSGRAYMPDTQKIAADINDPIAASVALTNRTWDVVVDFLAFTPEQIEQRIELFRGRTGQYVFISSASAYQKPLRGHLPITESTPLANPFWDYSRNKIACEDRLMRAFRDEEFPVVIVRPSLTYGNTVIPLAINSWQKSFTAIARLRRGEPLIIPGDGLTPWTVTHSSDFARGFVGLLGNAGTIGHAFHITSAEAPTWNDLYKWTAEAAGVPDAKFVHIASDFICACLPGMTGTLLGDKANPAIFDNSKIRRFVPAFASIVRYRDGIKRTIDWFDADPARQQVDAAMDAQWDKLIAAYERGLDDAKAEFL